MKKEKAYRLYDIFLYEDNDFKFQPVIRNNTYSITSLVDGANIYTDDHPAELEGPFSEYTQIIQTERGLDHYDIETFMFFAKAFSEQGVDIFALQSIMAENVDIKGSYQHPIIERYRSALTKNYTQLDHNALPNFFLYTKATSEELVKMVQELNQIRMDKKLKGLETEDEQLPF